MVNKTEGRIPLSKERVEAALRDSLETLKVLADAFDAGKYAVAFTMANEVYKIVSDNEFCVKIRSKKII